jgi:hypothetical protein
VFPAVLGLLGSVLRLVMVLSSHVYSPWGRRRGANVCQRMRADTLVLQSPLHLVGAQAVPGHVRRTLRGQAHIIQGRL